MLVTLETFQPPMSQSVLAEAIGFPEHILHVLHTTDVPVADVLVEGGGIVGRCPASSVTALVSQAPIFDDEGVVVSEHLLHVVTPEVSQVWMLLPGVFSSAPL